MSVDPQPETVNRLIHESSPYLLQHAYNPVDWYPWGEEAFEKARSEDKPIFLSVGYSSCHWCHVMERESFEDQEVAKELNASFVSIKVDREERPDVDAIYMTTVQLMTGQGGWPMSVFLTPSLEPFYGGTYFPRDTMYGRPGFVDVLRHLARTFRDDRVRVEEASKNLTQRLGDIELVPDGDGAPDRELLDVFYRAASQSFDTAFGGFGGAPKFPHSMDLSLLLQYWKRAGEQQALEMAMFSLRKMAEGGMYDQIGGGFHRYSVDRQWLVPHFEKMLYDNALLARTYIDAFRATGDELCETVATQILDYVDREMTDERGGFYSATDADSEGEEGKFFVWTPEEVEEVLGPQDAELLCDYFNLTARGNFENGASIPNVTRPLDYFAHARSTPAGELGARIEDCRRKLYGVRDLRVKPFRDEKVIAAWNGMMLSAMARGFQITGSERHREIAERAAEFVEEFLISGDVLHRIWKDDEAKIPGYLDDYAFLADAFIDLWEASFDLRHLTRARWLVDRIIDEFSDEEERGFYYSSARHTNLIHRRTEYIDNATPAAAWVAGAALLRLAALTGDTAYRVRAERVYSGLEPLVSRAPMGFATALQGVDFLLGPSIEIAVVGDAEDESTRAALAAIRRRLLPSKVVAWAPDEVDEATAKALPLLAGRGRVDGATAVYLCRDHVCKAPITELAELEKALDEL